MTFSGPTLKHFILRQQVINLYRSAIRASRGVLHHSIIVQLKFLKLAQSYQTP